MARRPVYTATGRLSCPARKKVVGITLVELMIALAVSAFLIVGAVTVFVQSRASYRVVDAVARLEENARFVLDALEPDLRMAQHFGLSTRADMIIGRAGPDDAAAFDVAGDCARNWAVHVDAAVEGSNNSYAWSCAARDGVIAGTDTLTVRRAAEMPEPPAEGRLHIQSARFRDSTLFLGSTVPSGYDAATSGTYRLIANGYYVSRSSTLSTPGNPVPSLRVKTLVDGPRIADLEVLPGVEDLQVQFGIDIDPAGGPGRGAIDRYVNPDDALLDRRANPHVRVLSVRVWLRLRAEEREAGFVDESSYRYADRNDPAPNDGYRRIVVSKTVYLRNARPAV